MPKEIKKRATRGSIQLGPQQCQYPGHCTNERAVKKNGDRHWLCVEHRDHQNALQRDRYRRVVSNKSRPAKPAKKERTAQKTNKKEASTAQKKKKQKTQKKVLATQKKGEIKSVPVLKVVEKTPALRPASAFRDHATVPERTAEPTAHGEQLPSSIEDMQQHSPACAPSLCVCQAAATMQLPQVVYVLVPVQLGPAQTLLTQNATFQAAGGVGAAQVQQVVLPVSQVACSPVSSPSSVCETSETTGAIGGKTGGGSSAPNGEAESCNVHNI